MTKEIKLNEAKVKSALSELKSIADQFESTFSSMKEEENKLDIFSGST
ncbi:MULTISPECIES: DUF5344 family protein [unclassified Oceanobacillus]|nr:DUF5344 family protein [Oceanobacillus sp. AG]